jgi:CDP-diglyceride synthetase
MSFQFIRAAKDLVPKRHWLRKWNIDMFDFNFFDKKPFMGSGLRVTSLVSITTLPFFFNYFLPQTLLYYFQITLLVFLGDILGSVIKRRFGYSKGTFMPLVDHGDYILLTGAFFVFQEKISFSIFLASLALTYVLHPIVCVIGYKMRIKKQPL